MTYRPPTSPRVLTLALFYLALTFVFAGELLIPGRSLFRWDTLIYTWPMVQEARAQILAGHWPFWASSFLCGTPLLENINAGVFYPMKLLVYFLPLQFGYQLFLFIHVWLTFLFTHLFLQRGLKLRATAAIIGALAFGASGYMRSMWDTHNFYAMPWIPLALFMAVKVAASVSEPDSVRSRSQLRTGILGLAFCFVMLIYGGDLEHAILTVPAILLLIWFKPAVATEVTEITEGARKFRLGSVLSVTAVVVIGIFVGLLLSAPQLIPARDWSHYSYRAAGMPIAEAAERSFHPARLIELLLPHFYGTRDGWNGEHLAYGTKTTPWCSSFHIGLVPVLLAVFAIAAAMQRRAARSGHIPVSGIGDKNVPATWWALALFIGGVLLAIGGFIEPLFRFVHSLPLLGSFRYPEKYLLWATLGLATLAAMGTEVVVAAFLRNAAGGSQNRRYIRFPRLTLVALAFISVLLPWYKELPTTSRFNPLDTPQFLIPILASDDPQGRIFVDPAVKNVPLPSNYATLRPSEREAIYLRESLAFNSPRLWGGRVPLGFSPAQSRWMRDYHDWLKKPGNDLPEGLRVKWFVTTKQNFTNYVPNFFPLVRTTNFQSWGDSEQIILAKILHPDNPAQMPQEENERWGVWRPWPGIMRCDEVPSSPLHSFVDEDFAPGWSAKDERGRVIQQTFGDHAPPWCNVNIQADTLQVRFNYEPPLWRRSLWVALAGAMIALAIGLVGRGKSRGEIQVTGNVGGGKFQWLEKSRWAVAGSCLCFVVVSVAARSHWSATFDEGFHLTRGLALQHFHDARLSYFHPPLQNALGGYFADLAFGDRLKYPVTEALQRGDALTYATEFARANGDVFNEAVRASRWGSLLFGLLLVAVGVWWTSRLAGPLAGWLTGIGLALNPNLIAHGNLNTTDMGVTALVVAGTALLWRAIQSQSLGSLAMATLVFVLASATKYTGLIWLGTTLAVVVPLLAWRWRNAKVLLVIPLGILVLTALITLVYGSTMRFIAGVSAQTHHAFTGHKAWFHGQAFEQSSWWHMPATLILKSPEVWIAGVVLAVVLFVVGACERRRRATERGSHAATTNLLFLLPAAVFAFLLFFVNNMAIGVRHALPLVALGTIAGAIAVARIASDRIRKLAAATYAGGMVLAAVSSYPNFISYFPAWAGGTTDGCRWLVDSNFDWGQGLDELEEQWAALTAENGGEPPNLVYYGFSDPRVTHKLRVGPQSYCGFMDTEGSKIMTNRLNGAKGLIVVSISAAALRPHGLDFSPLKDAEFVRRIGCFEVLRIPAGSEAHH